MKKAISFILLSVLLLGCISFPASAQEDYAVVYNTSYLNLRDRPDSSGQWLGRANEGEWVKIISTASNGWHYCEIMKTRQRGYMSGNFLTSTGTASGGAVVGVVNNPVSTQFLNLRQYPSYEAPVLGIFYNGAKCRILASQNGWYLVEIDGITGYFRSEFIRTGAGQGTAVVQTGNSGRLNLRNAPTMNGSGIIAKLYNGTQVHVLLKGDQFWKISVNGTTGYVDSKFLRASHTPVNPPRPPETHGYVIVNNPRPTQFLNLRAQPSTTAKVVAQYKNGIRLEVIAQGEEWCKVYGKATGNIGYVMTRFVREYGLPSVAVKTVSNGNTFVNLRSAPSKNTGAVYQKVYSDNQVTVLIPGDEWSRVRYGNTEGYMMTCFLK